MKLDRDFKIMIERETAALRITDWKLEPTPGGHRALVFVSPVTGLRRKLFMATTPSDHRALKNVRGQLRRLNATGHA